MFPDTPRPFEVKHCDPLPENGDGGAGGAGTLKTLLSTVRADSPHLAIGILDRDQEGCKAYEKLPAYFDEIPDIEAKVSRNGRAAGFLLPVPAGREAYARLLNLYMEFYFGEEVLSLRNEQGNGLELEQPEIEQRLMSPGNPVLATERSNRAETRRISSGKSVFAEDIVPALDAEEFEHFALIFERVRQVIQYLQ
jgi:hypothetical protein